MSGILGLWNLDGRPVDAALLARMSHALRHRGPDGEGHRTRGAAGFACRHLWVTREDVGQAQPLVGRAGAMLVMDGRLDNRDELVAALGLDRHVSDAACALAAYERWEDGFAERLSGDFAVAVFDEPGRRLVLARDAIGIRPLYYVRTPRLLAFASEIKGLLAHPDIPVRPDDEGLADYLFPASRPLDGQQITCFAGVSALVAAHVLVATPERVLTRQYWDFDTGHPLRLRSFGEYVEAYREHFATAVRRRIRSIHPVAVSLSGGLDSSSIFCQAETLRRADAALTPGVCGISYFGSEASGADERRYLADIEREYGVSVDRFPMDPLIGPVSSAEEQTLAVEAPFPDYMWGVTQTLHRKAKEAGATVLLSGLWGDQVLFSPAYLVDLFRRLEWSEIWRHTREYANWFGIEEARLLRRWVLADVVRYHLPRALVPPLKWLRRRVVPAERDKRWFTEAFRARALRFANRPARVGEGFHSAQARSIYLEVRSKYHVHCMEENNKVGAHFGVDSAFPFLDRDLLAFLMAIPGEIQNPAGVPRGLAREAMRGILPEPLRARKWKADFSGTVNEGVAQEADQIRRALSRDALGVRLGYLDAARLGPEVARLLGGLTGDDCTDSWDLVDLFALEVWLRVFLTGERASAVPTLPPQEGVA